MTKNISINPAKGISIIIKNDFQQPPPIKPKKKRKYKKKSNLDLLKMPTMPSYIPGSGDVSYIKPQYAATSLNRNMIFPGVPQSLPQLTPPPQLPQLTAPPTQPQLPAPQPFTFSLDNKFGSMLENILMPREYGFKTNSYAVDILDDDIIDSLPKAQQDIYIEKKIAPQIEEQMKGIEFDNEADKLKVYRDAVSIKTAKEWGTKHANSFRPFDLKYKDNDYYKQNYISKLQEILNQESIKTRAGIKTITTENKDKAKELLRAINVKPSIKVVVPEYVPPVVQPPATPPRPKPQAQVVSIPEEAKAPPPPKPAAAPPPPKPAAAPPPPPPPPGKGPPPPPPPPAAEKPKPTTSSVVTKEDEKALMAAGAIPLTEAIKDVLKTEPKDKFVAAGWTVGLKENDDVLDYLQDVINTMSEDTDFMKDFETSRGSGKIKFYKKYLEISALFKYNYVSKIKQTAWDMFLDTNDKIKEEFKDEPEPVKEVKQVDEEKLNKLSERAKTRGTGAKYDEEKRKEEEIKKKQEMANAKKKQEEDDKKDEQEKARKAEERRKKKKYLH